MFIKNELYGLDLIGMSQSGDLLRKGASLRRVGVNVEWGMGLNKGSVRAASIWRKTDDDQDVARRD